jgi:hypothetical protein
MRKVSRKDAKAQRTLNRVLCGVASWREILCLAILIACVAPLAYSQGCAMCYEAGAAQSEAGQAALNTAILWLFMPAIGIFCGVVIVARKHRAWWEKE